MQYNPRTGDIIFFKTKFNWKDPITYISCLIRPIAKIEYNHVGIIGCNWNEYYLFESIERGFLPSPIHQRLTGRNILVRRPLFNIDEKDFNIRLNNLAGKKYDFRGLFYDQLVLNLFHRWKGAKSEEEALRRLYCYEAYWYMFKEQFGDLWWKIYPQNSIYVSFTKTVFQGVLK